jgi:hypothetical protein
VKGKQTEQTNTKLNSKKEKKSDRDEEEECIEQE